MRSNALDILTQRFNVATSDIDKALVFQRKYGGKLEKLLVNIGAISEESLPDYYSLLLDTPRLDDAQVEAFNTDNVELSQPVMTEFWGLDWFPISGSHALLTIATAKPLSTEASQLIARECIEVKLLIADERQTEKLRLLAASQSPDEKEPSAPDELSDIEEERLRELAGEAPTVNLLNGLITRALRARASDMHLEPTNGRYRVRFRIDGVLQEVDSIPGSMRLPVSSRIKVLSGMDIAEKRRPQDGKIALKIANENLDIRVSALPLSDGESIVMRFLRQDAISYDMDVLGVSPDIEKQIREDLKTTAGVILLTGPTGSGKTTSLYTFLDVINDDQVKIITLEDPVEYQLEGVNQVQVKSDIGFDFAAGLRSIVRQDPDVIMVGEIRDSETGRIAMQSALTGHLVFSTVHTNDAPSAYTRLIDLGAEEYLLNAALVSIIAQRLVRKLCPHCATQADDSDEMIKRYQLENLSESFGIPVQLKQAVGCESCSHTGYKGRMAVMEYLRCDEDVKAIPKDQNFASKAKKLNADRGGRSLREDGFYKAMQGLTTIDEVLRVAG